MKFGYTDVEGYIPDLWEIPTICIMFICSALLKDQHLYFILTCVFSTVFSFALPFRKSRLIGLLILL